MRRLARPPARPSSVSVGRMPPGAVAADPFDAGWTRRAPTRSAYVRDAVAAGVLLVATLVSVALYASAGFTDAAHPAVSTLWALAMTLPLALRRRFPSTVAVALTAVYALGLILQVPESLFNQICLYLALYTVGAWSRDRRLALVVRTVVAVGMLVGAVAVVVAPFIVQLWTDLLAQRAARVRELQRAEIAAHLHDSVLQTLALIQNRADPSSEVSRIARAQERELRDWLFAGDAPAVDDLAAELQTLAAGIELDYAVRIDVVSTGSFITGHPSVVAAAREAMLNAAKHAGGTVSVYVESSPEAVDVFVRDRGAGFDLDALAGDRLGVKESIIGRMERAGGHATIRSLGPGTEVHLHWEFA